MKQYKVIKGEMEFKPKQLGLYYKKSTLKYNVKFDQSCRYDLKDVDQFDINKLFGLGYFCFEWEPHHIDSARYGWNYNIATNKIDLYSYYYLNKVKSYKFICSCDFDKTYTLFLSFVENRYKYLVWEENNVLTIGFDTVPFSHSKKFSFLLNPYFGGNEVAPHDMIIYMEKS